MPATRCFLFLQGPPSEFWARLADGLAAAGHRIIRVNLNLGDWLFWRRPGALNYRGTHGGWKDWLRALIAREGVTDIVYYADRLPYHIDALSLGREAGLLVHAIEFGYLRPDWLTIEPEAMGRRSTFPDDPDTIRCLAAGMPDPDMTPLYPHGFVTETWREVLYNLFLVFGRGFYPFYRSDKYYWPLVEYAAWLVRFAVRPFLARGDEALVDRAVGGAFPFDLIALQLQFDYQIRASSDFAHIEDMLDMVLRSFAAHAPADRHLVVKTHPLDNGLEFWPRRLARLCRRHGTAGRVHLVDTRRLLPLVRAAHGVILANSTVGLTALGEGAPVIALADAIYNLPGLTHQGGLDRFWTAPERPDPGLVRDFRRALAAHIQVRGSFYNAEGQRVAVAALVAKLGQAGGFRLPQRRSPRL
jgi:capsular polysaccharide export protein